MFTILPILNSNIYIILDKGLELAMGFFSLMAGYTDNGDTDNKLVYIGGPHLSDKYGH